MRFAFCGTGQYVTANMLVALKTWPFLKYTVSVNVSAFGVPSKRYGEPFFALENTNH
jgi:hypothetical protein